MSHWENGEIMKFHETETETSVFVSVCVWTRETTLQKA